MSRPDLMSKELIERCLKERRLPTPEEYMPDPVMKYSYEPIGGWLAYFTTIFILFGGFALFLRWAIIEQSQGL